MRPQISILGYSLTQNTPILWVFKVDLVPTNP